MRRLRVACIGTGFIAGKHLAALATFDDVMVVAVADSVVERAEAAAAPFGARAYSDGMELLAAEELDAVWLCVPPFAHGALEAAAADRGLPFLVEKPLACDLDTATAVAERVAETGVVTTVGYHWRHLSLVEEAQALLRDRPPTLVIGYWLDRTPPAPWWIQRSRSGGQVLEQTTHILDLARLLVGEVHTVQAVEVAAPADRATDDVTPVAASATFRFASGAIGTVASARFLHARHRVALQLMGDGYAVELSEHSLADHRLVVSTADGTSHRGSDEDPILREDRAFLDAVLGRRRDAVRVPYAEALRTHRLAWATDRSAREGGALLHLGGRDG